MSLVYAPMVASIPIPTLQSALFNRSSSSSALCRTHSHPFFSFRTRAFTPPSARLNLSELMGGRGLCNGEEGLKQELQRDLLDTPPFTSSPSSTAPQHSASQPRAPVAAFQAGEDAFEKELFGLTGGFPGGEKGLKRFIEENPPPGKGASKELGLQFLGTKPKPPELPLLMPGMIVIVKNPKNPFYMYAGIVQRVTDGKAGVLFEGGNWDKLLTFKLDELERRDKGPPMVNPKSAVLEPLVETLSSK